EEWGVGGGVGDGEGREEDGVGEPLRVLVGSGFAVCGRGSWLGDVACLDDLEDVAVGVAEEEAGEGRLALRLDQLRAMLPKPLLQCGEIRRRDGQGDVAAGTRLQRRPAGTRPLRREPLPA